MFPYMEVIDMGDCKEGTCSTEQQKGGADCCSGSSCNKSSGCEMTDMLMHIADSAWAELMKDKMKKLFETHRGKNMDKLAKASVEASLAYWEHKMKGKMACHENKEKLKQAMMG